MRSSVLSPAALRLVVSLAAFPPWLVPLCAASGAGLLRPNTAPTLTSANDTAAGAEKRRLHPPHVECVCSEDQFIMDGCANTGIPTLTDLRSQIGIVSELAWSNTTVSADGVVVVAKIGDVVVGELDGSVTVVQVTIPDDADGILTAEGFVTPDGETITTVQLIRFGPFGLFIGITVMFNEGGTMRAAQTGAQCAVRRVQCLEDFDCLLLDLEPQGVCGNNFLCASDQAPVGPGLGL
ncbi:unnamed protein product [Vitrella brassicaformis CCMP3155]|uniref:FAD-binding PCMH-type domain-containing protein n=1 Tax=Vitrella brassicaformis (strain CCMP3155) TaxID=1169540 RepID=A0A0G4EUJ1_VITBC|nr:unnamed protein product [Vitrella brassicaformis CCMP3155]|eukprot:CEM01970.1 unnamed protein product [Vitrella brassicaformis CCMP3155]